ncbi:MAG: hypothetical protein ACE5JB_13785 [bacterium]
MTKNLLYMLELNCARKRRRPPTLSLSGPPMADQTPSSITTFADGRIDLYGEIIPQALFLLFVVINRVLEL